MNTSDAALRALRATAHAGFTKRQDALFDLGDAVLVTEAVPSPVHLSLTPAHRRGWGSFYAALADGRLEVAALRAALACQPLADGRPGYAVDCSVWARDDAEASPERGYYYHPSRPSAGRPPPAAQVPGPAGPTSGWPVIHRGIVHGSHRR
jgi:hypothetical protein